jgi:CO/xanthine dehydrogenase Mo-binding subunit
MQSAELKVVGKSLPIHDVRQKLTGSLRYVGDLRLPGLLHAKLVLSEIAHGRILEIDSTEAEALPGVIAVFSHANSPAILYNSHKWIEGLEVVKDERLFTDHVRFHGDRVAAVVAETKEIAEQAVRLIRVVYEELPPVIDPEAALRPDSQPIHASGNRLYHKRIACGDASARMSEAHLVIEDRIETPKVHHAAMETHGCLADIDASGALTIYTPCQVIFQVQLIVSEALDMPLDKVHVIKTTLGGSFGGKGQPILEPVAAFLSRELRRPVRLVLDRRETILSTRMRTKTVGRVRTGVDREGRIVAREMDLLVDTGAYCTNGEAIAMAMGKKTFRLYRIQDQTYTSDVVYTNTPIGGACRGYGSPQICAVTELNLDHAARLLQMDPVEFRLRNLVRPFDVDPAGGPEIGNARIIDCVLQGRELFDWVAKRQSVKDSGRFRKGTGMACCTHGNGYFGAYPDFITIDIRLDSCGTVILKGAFHDLGCGTVTTMMQIAAEVKALDIARVFVPEADTNVCSFDSAGTQASRVTFVCGGAVKKAAELLMAKLVDCAALMLDCSAEAIVTEQGHVYDRSRPEARTTYQAVASYSQKQLKADLSVNHVFQSPGNPASFGAHFAEVEVDTITGRVRVLDYVAVHDIGRAINRGFVEGQIQGSVQMGLGMALSEEIAFDAKGRITTAQLSRYTVFNAPEMPPVRVALIEEGEASGPFGAKSIGEIATVPVAPAVVSAINDALGTNLSILPALPERIVAAFLEKTQALSADRVLRGSR